MAAIQVNRGVFASLPTLASGELYWCTDTNQLFIGDPSGNEEIGTGGSLADGDYGDIVVSSSGAAINVDSAVLDAANMSTTVPPFSFELVNLSLRPIASANALQLAIVGHDGNDPSSANPVKIPFRNSALTSGVVSWLTLTAATSVTISSGSTLGTVNSTPFRLWIVVFNDGGTARVGVINCASLSTTAPRIYPLAESGFASSTAEGGAGAADSIATIYTGTAVTGKPFRVIGYAEYGSGLATAGTWASDPTTIQVYGPGIRLPGQTVQMAAMTTSTGFTTTSATFQTTTITQAITPSSAANFVRVHHDGSLATDGTNKTGLVRIYRDSTGVGPIAGQYLSSSVNITPCAQSWLDAPQSTSSITYSAKLSSPDGATTVEYPTASLGSAPYGSMTVEEIMG